MPKRPRTQAHTDADRRYQKTVKRVIISFKQDSDSLAYLRSQVTSDKEIPGLIKQIIEQHKK